MTATARQPAVLLLSPGIIKWTDVDFGLPHLVSLGGFLQAHLPVRVEILDLGYEGGDHRHLARRIAELGPFALVGVSAYSSYDHLRALALGAFLRKLLPDVPLVAGGYHAMAVPQQLLADGSPFDAVVVGEGEIPLRDAVATVLGGGPRPRGVLGPAHVDDLDALPPYRWELLARYWPRARQIGRKLQLYLSRGCPYDCTFCMERTKSAGAKAGRRWRAFSPERALDELRRLAVVTEQAGAPLSDWIVNIADPLFGLKPSWRRTVLDGIVREGIRPRQFWTLTRSDDLDDEDVRLLVAARFSIGLGLESGSPTMLSIMNKAARPERYLAAVERLARLTRLPGTHGLNWAANVIVGHPGETPETMAETAAFVRRLFTDGAETRGWLSIDPFRLYPGSHVHEHRAEWEQRHGARIHHPEWWTSWYDASFRAEHVDPSASLDYEGRVRRTYETYGPIVNEITARFRGQGRDVDRVFRRSVKEQARLMGPAERDRLLARAAASRPDPRPGPHASGLPGGRHGRPRMADGAPAVPAYGGTSALRPPIGFNVRDPWVRRREWAIRRLLEVGVLRTESIIEALLAVSPERFVTEDAAQALLADRADAPASEGRPPAFLGLRTIALGLEALQPGTGERVADALATSGYVAALLALLVGTSGRVVAVVPGTRRDVRALTKKLAGGSDDAGRIDVVRGVATTAEGLAADGPGGVDALWMGGALPRRPPWLAEILADGGRALLFLGPRFRPQDVVCAERRSAGVTERTVARAFVPVLAGPHGWLREAR